VYRARDKETNLIVALKKLRMKKEKGGFPLTSIREIKILKSIDHPNIVSLLEVSVGRKPDSIFLVFEYCEHDFAGLLDRLARPFTEAETKTIMLQLLSAVEHLHSRFIIHRDLKLSNLLLNKQGLLKLADFGPIPCSLLSALCSLLSALSSLRSLSALFSLLSPPIACSPCLPALPVLAHDHTPMDAGLARLFSNPLQAYTPKVVTLWYRCPEILLGCEQYASLPDCEVIHSVSSMFKTLPHFLSIPPLSPFRYHTAVDMWAVGCIFGELLRHKPLLPGQTEIKQLQLIFKLLGVHPFRPSSSCFLLTLPL
jgi:cyclin-dependent kinase 10